MATPDVVLKALAAVVCGVFAVIVLGAVRRRPAVLALGGFLLLLAVNAAAEVFRGLAPSFGAEVFWRGISIATSAMDPVALLAFTLLDPPHPHRKLWLSGTAAASLALVLAVPWAISTGFFALAFLTALVSLFTATVYLSVLVLALRRFAAAGTDPRPGLLAAGILFATVPRICLTFEDFLATAAAANAGRGPANVIYLLADALVLVVVASLILRLVRGTASRIAHRALFAAAAVMVVIKSYDVVRIPALLGLPEVHVEALLYVGRGAAPIRWLGFGALVSSALVRHDLLGLSLQARRRVARLLIALTMFILGSLLVVIVGASVPGIGLSIGPLEIILVFLAIALSQGFRELIDGVAFRFYGVPLPGNPAANQETYRAAAIQAVAQGRDAERDPDLRRLRDEMGIDVGTATLIERLAESSVATPLSPGRLVGGRYRVQRLVGRGGSGRAFLAHDERLDREVVLKEVFLDGARDEDEGLREARLAGSVQHPNVVTVHDALQRAGSTLLVAEYVPGGSLAERLSTSPPTPEQALRLLRGVAEGLAAMHARGILHRDIKAENILVTREGQAKIADFGLARLRRGETVGLDAPSFAGTPESMAPEQKRGGPLTSATDVYALGLLAQRLLFAAPPSVRHAIETALQEDMARRPSADSFALACAAALVEIRSVPVHEKASPDANDVSVA